MSDQSFPGDRPMESDRPQPERVTRRDLAEGNAEKVVNERTEQVLMFKGGGGANIGNMRDLIDEAKLLSTAGPMLPPWLQGNVGGMFGVCMKAHELGISPLTLASWTYIVENKGEKRVSYESQFFHALIEAQAPITSRLNVEYEGDGDNRRCRVFATFKGEREPRYFPPKDADPNQFTLGKLRPTRNDSGKVKGSPLWDLKPDLQLFYNMSRDWARMYCPDIIGGMYGRDEMEDAGFVVASETPKDVSPRLAERLRGNAPAIGQAALATLDAYTSEVASRSQKQKAPADAVSDAA
ncbi:hypothetical protein GA0061099_103018 [Bradyrhizobium yuanmingense]|uniref:Recombinase RecT n=1 Tax=Bradyrhizobium yuanmingense TaxID=108015 RepID=A0A1C3XJ13_9BRAD|nr:recombinase RecT [Bradyrhizobium yuanmingense]TWI17769.1 hypothetical protein IQ15_07359 [Bradyrhizobium yuanmingense]SCB52272.1 hypothetical protein GA0061099_103018 [Bradyrhizobium yuanmingense]